ncbi:MAG: NAD(P)/FAD-dependent oxidoreductase [Flavipsychrobacter sp.]|nr:NAD(P)/FAD-dependent oxidoreductase [Flavipsychrobacter sp.]
MINSTGSDVIIIGGGLAGLALSILLAQQHRMVTVFEKDDYPRHKVCGEYISMESFPFLEQLGIPLSDMQLPVISKLLLTDVHGNEMFTDLPQGGFGISRYMLDDLLAKRAVACGVVLNVKTRVDDVLFDGDTFTVLADGKKYSAKIVCGAWGKRANMDVKWHRPFIIEKQKGLDNYIGVKYHVRLPWADNLIAMHNFNGGYCGISRIEDEKCCLCYLTTAATLKQNGNDIAEMERNVLMKNPALGKIFSEAEFLYDAPVTISQISFRKKGTVLNHVLLLGDAAGMITPLCGNGMSIALHTAKIAFRAVDNFFVSGNRKQMEYVYNKEWCKNFYFRIFAGRVLQRIFEKQLAGNMFLSIFKKLGFLHQPVINLTSGRPF